MTASWRACRAAGGCGGRLCRPAPARPRGDGQHQDGAAVPGGGQAAPARRQVEAYHRAARLLVGVGRGASRRAARTTGGVEVGAQPRARSPSAVGVVVAGVEQVVHELAADPVLGLDPGTQAEHQQRGDHGGPLDDALVDVVERPARWSTRAPNWCCRRSRPPPTRAVPGQVVTPVLTTAWPSAPPRRAVGRRPAPRAGARRARAAPSSTSTSAAPISSTPPPRSTSLGQPVVGVGGPLHDCCALLQQHWTVRSSSRATGSR